MPPSLASADENKASSEKPDNDKAKDAKPTATESTKAESAKAESAEDASAKAESKPTSATPAKAAGGADGSSIMVRIVPGITRYHKEDCLLIRFLAEDDLEVMSLKSANDEGYFACKACKPDQSSAN